MKKTSCPLTSVSENADQASMDPMAKKANFYTTQ